MNYEETLQFLYESVPMFQQEGKTGYKEGLSNTLQLDCYFKHPHRSYKTIHVAGTNGKGSCSHTIAATLQAAGYKVGLYTSPHLLDFRERVRVNGTPMNKEYVVNFVRENEAFFMQLHPSFFELTTAMAFLYFALEKVDIAVIEVGLGGRLDCTNIITPLLSIITNISFDHVQFLGHSLAQIAKEKGGIIKSKTPIVIGESTPETKAVFESIATQKRSTPLFAEEKSLIKEAHQTKKGTWLYTTKDNLIIEGELGGLCQLKNANTVLNALQVLEKKGFTLSSKAIKKGFSQVCELTGLMGRWQKLGEKPTIICDTGHNVGGITYIVQQLKAQTYAHLHIVIGMVNDKDINSVLSLLPSKATYYFTQASVKRALPAKDFQEIAKKHGLKGEIFTSVEEAIKKARTKAEKNDFIFIGGSTFIVADALSCSIFNEYIQKKSF